jgi:hypothetical protein
VYPFYRKYKKEDSMHRYLLNNLSNSEFIILTTCLVLIVAFTLTYVLKKYFSHFMSYENNRFVGFFVASISANYGFILGFIIVTLWRELYEVKSYVLQEAESLSLLVYNASAFPSTIQNEIINEVTNYIKIVTEEEWPLMRFGNVSPKTVPIFTNLFHIIQSYTPETSVEISFYNQSINNLNRLIEFRRKRLEYLDSSLSDILRFILIFGVVVILSLIALLDTKSKTLKFFTLTLASIMLSLNLSLALLLDYPFAEIEGETEDLFAVSSHPFTAGILEQFDPNRK